MTLTADQLQLRDALRGLLVRRSDSAAVRKAIETETGYDTDLWRTLCDQIGVPGLAVPERCGGAGGSLAEAGLALGELARSLTPSPALGSLLTTELLLGLGDEDACGRLVPRVASGDVVALAWAGEHGWSDGAATLADGTVSGTAHYVLDGDLADTVLVVTPGAVVEIAADAPGVSVRRTAALDPTRRLATVSLHEARGRVLSGSVAAGRSRARRAGCVALAAEATGAAARLLELTVAYTTVRVQFGRPIGSFQALKHRMADLHVLVESSRSAAHAAATAELDPSVAKVYCAEAFQSVAAEAIQLHGGIAITWEHDAHLYLKRAYGIATLLGTAGEHLRQIAVKAGIEDA